MLSTRGTDPREPASPELPGGRGGILGRTQRRDTASRRNRQSRKRLGVVDADAADRHARERAAPHEVTEPFHAEGVGVIPLGRGRTDHPDAEIVDGSGGQRENRVEVRRTVRGEADQRIRPRASRACSTDASP